MPTDVVDLVSSDDDDESANKKASALLSRFTAKKDVRSPAKTNGLSGGSRADSGSPRKDARSPPKTNGLRTEVARETGDYESPEQDARSLLSSFKPRVNGQSGNGGLNGKHGRAGTDGVSGAEVGYPVPRNSLGALPAPRLASTPNARSSSSHGELVSGHGARYQQSPAANRSQYAIPANDTAQPEEGSLAALLRQSQADGRPPSRNGTMLQSPRPALLAQRPPAQKQHLSQGNPPLEIVDTFMDAHATMFEDIRPFKRQRLSGPSLAIDQAKTTPPDQDFRSEGDTVPPKAVFVWPRGDRTAHKERVSGSSDVNGERLAAAAVERVPRQERPKAYSSPSMQSFAPKGVERSPQQPQPVIEQNHSPTSKSPALLQSGGQHPIRFQKSTVFKPQPIEPAMTKGAASSFGSQYTPEEDALLAELKEVKKIPWPEMPKYFHGRTQGSLQVRYSSKVSNRHHAQNKLTSLKVHRSEVLAQARETEASDSGTGYEAPARRQRKKRNTGAAAVDGFISWADLKKQRQATDQERGGQASEAAPWRKATRRPQFTTERAHPRPLSCILRQRELGSSGRCVAARATVFNETKEHAFDNLGPLKYHKGTSGDVTCIAWSPNGQHFAAGSIAISDDRSMQYNRPGNLLLGDYERQKLHELPEHHIPRPTVEAGNVNALHSMRESQDPRLFMTVASVQFSPDSSTLYAAGTDSKVRAYDVTNNEVRCAYTIDHHAPLDLLSVSNTNLLATACHQSADGSIGIYKGQDHVGALSPSRVEQQTSRAIFPSALRWGAHCRHSNLLLAGFSIDSIDEERGIAGETCLWNVETRRSLSLPVTRNVFDVAWNPIPTSTSTAFAVASVPTQKVTRGSRTVIQYFALDQNNTQVSRVLEWESPAFDINDVVFCQHDDNLIAAGATDGRVFVWDRRFAGRKPTSLHLFEHADSLSVLDHDRKREIADTGVRFLSWGATSTRLYSGSSDGVVKVWNPYMATENAHIKDVAAFDTAVMSGAFSPDYRDLLIGEDQGRISSLSIGHGEKAVRSMRKFDFVPAPAPQPQDDDRFDAAHHLLESQQVVFRPMGNLPVRQAVQGPKYSGPYLVPTEAETDDAEQALDEALIAQNAALRQQNVFGDQQREVAVADAAKRVKQAREDIAQLNAREHNAAPLYQSARENQLKLHRAEKQRFTLEASLSHALECCKLDCNYLPAETDEGEVADSGRSEGRIPDALRCFPPRDVPMLTLDELQEAGLTRKCIACTGPAAQPKVGLPLCESCANARRGLLARCSQCATPIRPPANEGEGLCEKCRFACFRCGENALVTSDRRHVVCDACDLTWTIGVLGYELVGQSGQRSKGKLPRTHLEFGEDEMERHAAKWGR